VFRLIAFAKFIIISQLHQQHLNKTFAHDAFAQITFIDEYRPSTGRLSAYDQEYRLIAGYNNFEDHSLIPIFVGDEPHHRKFCTWMETTKGFVVEATRNEATGNQNTGSLALFFENFAEAAQIPRHPSDAENVADPPHSSFANLTI